MKDRRRFRDAVAAQGAVMREAFSAIIYIVTTLYKELTILMKNNNNRQQCGRK